MGNFWSTGKNGVIYSMISVNNFYWILYETLLKPVELDCWYYYPWGTTQNLSCLGEYKTQIIRGEHHALFHFDQEPLYSNNLGQDYDISRHGRASWSVRMCKLLANSEHSDIKREICHDRSMLDWYYFYHGFAALDWFRDSRYIGDIVEPSKIFSSYNHLVRNERSYRMALTALLIKESIISYGDVSFHSSWSECEQEIQDPWSNLNFLDKENISNCIIGYANLPMILDSMIPNGQLSARFGHQEFKLWQRSFWHVVNETIFYQSKLHLTEKIFKPIVALRPFLLVAAPGNLRYLRSYGFKTFSNWIDESYDDEKDNHKRLIMITEQLKLLCGKSSKQLQVMHNEMLPVLIHNKTHMFGQFQKIIVKELVQNFDSCIRVWNNGRVDGRDLPLHPDLEHAEQTLLG